MSKPHALKTRAMVSARSRCPRSRGRSWCGWTSPQRKNDAGSGWKSPALGPAIPVAQPGHSLTYTVTNTAACGGIVELKAPPSSVTAKSETASDSLASRGLASSESCERATALALAATKFRLGIAHEQVESFVAGRGRIFGPAVTQSVHFIYAGRLSSPMAHPTGYSDRDGRATDDA